jgi:peptide/nickel transport system ATP-binding protein
VVGLVGATGAGKSTLGMLLLRLLEPDEGSVHLEGRDLLAARGSELKAARRRVQMLFQDPFEALSARLTVAQAVREPLDTQDLGEPDGRDEVVRAMVGTCRLPTDDAFLRRNTHELSGGQLQRVALARALVLDPKLLVADEAVAMLDPSEQAKMIQLLKHLQTERGMSMVFISHDLAVVLRVADRVLILDDGRVVEEGSGSRLLGAPQHPTTRALLAGAGRDLLFAAEGDGGDNGCRPPTTPAGREGTAPRPEGLDPGMTPTEGERT